jgi:hypothetical protein
MSNEVVANYRELLPDVVADAIEGARILPMLKPHIIAEAVYLTIIQSATECTALLSQPTVTAGGVLRGILESYADLCSLVKSPAYGDRMLATLLKEKVRLADDMLKNPGNEFHADLAKQLDPATMRTKAKAELDELHDQGCYPLSNFQRLECAGLGDLYKSIYWQLCLDTHNSIQSVQARHLEQTEHGIGLTLFKENTRGEVLKFYDTLVAIVINASYQVHSLVNTGVAPKWEQWQVRLDEIRAKYQTAAPKQILKS